MPLTLARATLAASLPLRSAGSGFRAQRQISCMVHKVQQPSEPHLDVPACTLALSTLLITRPAFADEVEAAAGDAASSSPLGISAAGWGLAFSPLVFYALFNLYRSQINPRAKFGDAVFAFAACVILANIIAITVFKTRIY